MPIGRSACNAGFTTPRRVEPPVDIVETGDTLQAHRASA
jgi:hypothetical protein